MQSLTNIILFPSENILKTELRGSKGDLKRPFDRAWRDYQDKFSDLERMKKKQAKEAGMIRSELAAGEIAEEMDKERKYLQIAIADYMVKVNEILDEVMKLSRIESGQNYKKFYTFVGKWANG